MALDEKVWVFGFKMASESAKLLADKLDVWMIKHEGSNFRGKKGQFIVNWGAGTGVFTAAAGGARVLNRPEAIDRAVNKLAFFKQMLGEDAPRCPHWTKSPEQAKAWLANGLTVIARTKVEGAKGDGIVVMKKPLDFVLANLYTIKVDNLKEYRVYMWGNEVIDARIKLTAKGAKADPDDMRFGDQYEFCRFEMNELPADVVVQAKRAMAKTGLDMGGLDILWDGDEAWVLECNTAPYLGDITATKYAKKIEELAKKVG